MQSSVDTMQVQLDMSQREISELREELSRVREVAMVDGLTGLLNRTAFDRRLAALAAEETDAETPQLCLVMMDIDHFKQVNDNFGHVFGDHVLVAIAAALKATVKGRDAAARYGGEEFALLLPNTPIKGAQVVAEQVREAIGHKRVRRGDKILANITVSVGVAAYRSDESIASFIERADAALYASKREGRNRVTLAA
jgi:diguanylate cyclase